MISNRSGTVPPKIYFYLIKFYYFGSVSNLMLLLLFSSQNSLSILLFDKNISKNYEKCREEFRMHFDLSHFSPLQAMKM